MTWEAASPRWPALYLWLVCFPCSDALSMVAHGWPGRGQPPPLGPRSAAAGLGGLLPQGPGWPGAASTPHSPERRGPIRAKWPLLRCPLAIHRVLLPGTVLFCHTPSSSCSFPCPSLRQEAGGSHSRAGRRRLRGREGSCRPELC